MKLFISYYDTIKQRLLLERTQKILNNIKKPYSYNYESIVEGGGKGQMIVERTDLAEDGTIRMYVKDKKEPIRMYPDTKVIWIIAYYKRLIPLVSSSLREMGWNRRIISVLAIKYNFKIISQWFEYLFSMDSFLLKDENWSQPVKELRRVLKGHLNQNLIDALALIIEYDSAYRYRFQDIVSLLKKENLNKPIKEIMRLLGILIKRDGHGDLWTNIEKNAKWFLWLSPKIKKQITSILMDINIDEIKFSKEDIYWTNQNPHYPFRGMTIEQRKLENIKNYGE